MASVPLKPTTIIVVGWYNWYKFSPIIGENLVLFGWSIVNFFAVAQELSPRGPKDRTHCFAEPPEPSGLSVACGWPELKTPCGHANNSQNGGMQ